MAHPRHGLRVKWCENVARYTKPKGGLSRLAETVSDGWFIQVWICKKWHSIMDLRFERECDAVRAAQCLTAAGLGSHHALEKADPLTVRQVACEMLQW